MYSSLLNNPEFTNVLMGLLAQKGVEVGDKETTNQLVELLKSNPEFLRSFLSGGGQEGEVSEMDGGVVGGAVGVDAGAVGDEMQLQLRDEIQQSGVSETAFHEMEGVAMGLSSAAVQFGDLSMDNQDALMAEQVDMQPPTTEQIATTAPIPPLRTTAAIEPPPLPSQQTTSTPVPSFPSLSIPPPYIASTIAHPPPPPERIQAFGFPPRMGQSQK
jgi:hypothetical protein